MQVLLRFSSWLIGKVSQVNRDDLRRFGRLVNPERQPGKHQNNHGDSGPHEAAPLAVLVRVRLVFLNGRHRRGHNPWLCPRLGTVVRLVFGRRRHHPRSRLLRVRLRHDLSGRFVVDAHGSTIARTQHVLTERERVLVARVPVLLQRVHDQTVNRRAQLVVELGWRLRRLAHVLVRNGQLRVSHERWTPGEEFVQQARG